jgi:hypothetical protein
MCPGLCTACRGLCHGVFRAVHRVSRAVHRVSQAVHRVSQAVHRVSRACAPCVPGCAPCVAGLRTVCPGLCTVCRGLCTVVHGLCTVVHGLRTACRGLRTIVHGRNTSPREAAGRLRVAYRLSSTLARVQIAARLAIAGFVLIGTACASTRDVDCAGLGNEPRPPRNFGVVRDASGEATPIYRGGQPMTCGELEYLRAAGVKTILKLNDRHLPVDVSEQDRARAIGLGIRSFAFNAATIGTSGTCESVRAALSFLADPANQPVFVHCTAGKDRTGYIVGMYEKLFLKKTTDAVLSELHQYGHTGFRSVLMGQIDAELQAAHPACAPAANQALYGER